MELLEAVFEFDNERALLTPGRPSSFDAVFVDFQVTETGGGRRYNIYLHPKKDIAVRRLELVFSCPLPPSAAVLTNGWQSASESRLVSADSRGPSLRKIAAKRFAAFGDEAWRGPEGAHSWTYTLIKSGNRSWLAASLNERSAFTDWQFSPGRLTAHRDIEQLQLGHSFPALDIWIGEGVENDLFDQYRLMLELPETELPKGLGWTTAGLPAEQLTESGLLEKRAALQQSALPFRWFLLDAGWQSETGDWLSAGPGFPHGPGSLAARIQEAGLEPGIWLAPFVAVGNSGVARLHADWLLQNEKGKPLRAGWDDRLGGWFYVLNFYHPAVQEYLSGVFHRVFDQWGFQMVKLDFLFAAALQTPAGKTRGQVMNDVMTFLAHQGGTRTLFAADVPLGAAFGLAGIGAVAAASPQHWESGLLARLHFRERLGALPALRSALARWQLGGSMFAGNLGAFSLRSGKKALRPAQQYTLLVVSALLSQVMLTSDNPADYSPEQYAELEEALDLQNATVQSVQELQPDVFRIDYWLDETHFKALVNLQNKPVSADGLRLDAYETVTLRG